MGFIAVDKNFNRLQFNNESFISIYFSVGFQNRLSPFNLNGGNFEDECLLELIRLKKY